MALRLCQLAGELLVADFADRERNDDSAAPAKTHTWK